VGEDTAVKVLVVGSSPAWPNPGSAHAGYLVDERLLLDCGPGVLARLRERWPWPPVEAIVITHFHLDHWGDLVPWVWGAKFGPGRDAARVDLWLPADGRDELSELGKQLGSAEMFDETFWVREYADGVPFRAAGLQLTAARVPHYDQATYAVRVSDGDGTVTYSGDSAPAEALIEIARDADLFVCEATLDQDGEGNGERGHLSAEEARDVAVQAGARRLLLTHRPHELGAPDGIEVAYDGLELTV
jgi:ribonuclease BN (tRNA processing enzyme)